MVWLLPRLLTALAVAAVAALIGHLAATVLGLPTTGWAIASALLGLALVAARDALRAGHLMAWLRGAQSADAPRDTGFWGELGYRMERALRCAASRSCSANVSASISSCRRSKRRPTA